MPDTIAILDFRISNPTEVQFVVRDVEATLNQADTLCRGRA